MTRAVLLACSQRKRSEAKPLRALERYDGPLFRVLRKYAAAGASIPTTWILSAKYGLISGDDLVSFYDQRMTRERAERLRATITQALVEQFHDRRPDALFVAIGRDYAPALTDAWTVVEQGTEVMRASGSIGGMSAQLRDWLYGQRRDQTHAVVGHASLLGVTVRQTTSEVLVLAESLARTSPAAVRLQHWCVRVNGSAVAPKCLVSELTGLPVSRFRTADAVRLLSRLGVSVERHSTGG